MDRCELTTSTQVQAPGGQDARGQGAYQPTGTDRESAEEEGVDPPFPKSCSFLVRRLDFCPDDNHSCSPQPVVRALRRVDEARAVGTSFVQDACCPDWEELGERGPVDCHV